MVWTHKLDEVFLLENITNGKYKTLVLCSTNCPTLSFDFTNKFCFNFLKVCLCKCRFKSIVVPTTSLTNKIDGKSCQINLKQNTSYHKILKYQTALFSRIVWWFIGLFLFVTSRFTFLTETIDLTKHWNIFDVAL